MASISSSRLSLNLSIPFPQQIWEQQNSESKKKLKTPPEQQTFTTECAQVATEYEKLIEKTKAVFSYFEGQLGNCLPQAEVGKGIMVPKI